MRLKRCMLFVATAMLWQYSAYADAYRDDAERITYESLELLYEKTQGHYQYTSEFAKAQVEHLSHLQSENRLTGHEVRRSVRVLRSQFDDVIAAALPELKPVLAEAADSWIGLLENIIAKEASGMDVVAYSTYAGIKEGYAKWRAKIRA